MVRILICSLLLLSHPVHVSFLSIDYVPESKSVNLFLQLYHDDFLLDAGIRPTDRTASDSLRSDRFLSDLILKYANNKIKIAVNNEYFSANLDEYNLLQNELKVHLSFTVERKISTIAVQNLIMTQLYSDQENMVIIKVNEFEKGIKLTANKTEQTFEISKSKKE
jgi:hypothetical protein